MNNTKSQLGREYFLEAIPIELDELTIKKTVKKDVTVDSDDFELLRSLGMIYPGHDPID
tara:strand:- start:373 stop:549 length:177 start_codon:yes stop_codon:yes gene_type:complete